MEDSITLQYVPKQELDDDANLFNTSINPPYATGLSTSTISAMHPNDPNAASGHPMLSSMHPAGLSSTPSNPWGHSSAPHHHDGFASANAYGYPLDDRATTYVAQSQTGPVQDAMNGLPPISSVNSMSLPVPSSTATLPLTSAALSSVSRPTSTLHSPVHEGFGSFQQAFGPEGYNRPEPAIRNDSFPRTDSFPRIDMLSKNESLARARSRALSYSGPYGLPGQTQQASGFHASPTEYAPQILPPLHTQQLASPYHSQAPSPISQHPPPTHALSPLHHQAMLSQQQAYHSQAQAQPMAAPLNHIPHPQNHTHSSAFYLEEGGQLSNAPQGAGVNSSGHPHLYTPPLTSAASTHVQPSSAAALSSSAVIDATANLASVTPSSSSAIGGSSASTSGSPASITAANNTSPSAFAGSNSFHTSGTGPTILGASSGTGTPPGMGTNGHSAAAPPPPVVPLSGVVTPTSALSPTSAATVMSTATSSLNSSLPPPIPPLNASIGTGGPPSIPRSMSLNSIPSSGTRSGASTPFHIASGRATPSGILGPSSASGSIPPPSRLGRMGVPSIMIPAPNLSMSASSLNSAPVATGMYVDTNQAYQFTHQDYMYGPGSTVVSPSTPMILSSLLRGSASGPGTASNGGSVPLTPINDDGVHNFDYHLSTRMNGLDMGSTPSSMGGMVGSGMHTSMVGGMNGMNEMPMGGMHVTMNGGPVHDDMDGIEEDEDEDDEDMYYGNSANPNVLTMASRSRSTSALNMALSNGSTASLVGGGGSPRRSNVSGVERTQKKRRSATIAAGPSAAAVGASRSRSGTLIGGNHPPTIIGANGLPIPASMMGMGGVMGNPALAFSPIDSMPPAVSNSAVGPQSTQLNPSLGMPNNNTNGVNGVTVAAGVGVGGQANSPLAMKELSASMKSVIEGYLLRYLNYLCMNPNAKDRMGHQIHQMYTARRIQRYEQLYGWRPLKFRIEAFVNGFVDLLTAKGLSQDVTMKIPHYLNNSKLFSRFNESGNRMKSQGQTIWRVRARCRTDIAAMDPAAAAAVGQSSSQHSSPAYQVSREDAGLMMAPLPLLWEFLPYERCIVGQPPLAIVGTAWQWNMKVHDHWTPRKKVTWNLVSNNSAPSRTGSSPEIDPSSSPSASSSASNSLPTWLTLQGSKLKGTPTQPGVYPISIEATFQEDNDPEPVVVRGNFTIQVSKAIGAYKTKVPVAPEGLVDSPPEVGGDGFDADGNDLQGGSGHGDGSLSGGPSMTQMAYAMPQGDASRTLYFPSYSYSYVH